MLDPVVTAGALFVGLDAASGGAAFPDMRRFSRRYEPTLESGVGDAFAEIDLFVVHEVALIERADSIQNCASQQHCRADDQIDSALRSIIPRAQPRSVCKAAKAWKVAPCAGSQERSGPRIELTARFGDAAVRFVESRPCNSATWMRVHESGEVRESAVAHGG